MSKVFYIRLILHFVFTKTPSKFIEDYKFSWISYTVLLTAIAMSLPPLQYALGISSSYCLPKSTTLIIKEKVWSFSGDTYQITDKNNIEIVRCQGKTMSFTKRKEFRDLQGNQVFSLRKKLFAFHKTFYAQTPNKKILFKVKSKFSSIFSLLFL